MLKLTCLCGQVRVDWQSDRTSSTSAIARYGSKSGARWSYFHPSEVSIEGATREYSREEKTIRPQKSTSAADVVRLRISL
jgi:hypothetical protein